MSRRRNWWLLFVVLVLLNGGVFAMVLHFTSEGGDELAALPTVASLPSEETASQQDGDTADSPAVVALAAQDDSADAPGLSQTANEAPAAAPRGDELSDDADAPQVAMVQEEPNALSSPPPPTEADIDPASDAAPTTVSATSVPQSDDAPQPSGVTVLSTETGPVVPPTDEPAQQGSPDESATPATDDAEIRDIAQDVAVISQTLASEGRPVRVIVEFASAVPPLSSTDAAVVEATVASANQAILQRIPDGVGLQVQSTYRYSTTLVVTIESEEGLQFLAQMPDVIRLQEDIPQPPTMAQSLPMIGADDLHTQGADGSGYAVVILDTGIDTDHQEFGSRIMAEACFNSNDAVFNATTRCPGGGEFADGPGAAEDCTNASGCGHGTHVSGIAAGNSGVAPGASIVAINVFSEFDSSACGSLPRPCVLAFVSDQEEALEHVEANYSTWADPVVAVNMSLGGGRYYAPCPSSAQTDEIVNLLALGIATVISSGNSGYSDSVGSPGCIADAWTVASSNDTSDPDAPVLSDFSNMGVDLVDFIAPGYLITSSVPGPGGDDYADYYGTSMAAPHVAGAIALLFDYLDRSDPQGAVLNDIQTALTNTGPIVTDTRPGNDGASAPHIRLDLAAQELISVPYGNMTSPAWDSATASNSVQLSSVIYDDDSAVSHVDYYYLDGSNWILIQDGITAPYDYTWDISAFAEGRWYVMGKMWDVDGNWAWMSGDSEWTRFWIDRTGPSGTIISPANESGTNANNLTLEANLNDTVSDVDTIDYYYYDGSNWTLVQAGVTSPFTYDWDISSLTDGDYRISGIVSDVLGNSTTLWTDDIYNDFYVDRTAPTSTVDGLPARQTDPSFDVTWVGSDPVASPSLTMATADAQPDGMLVTLERTPRTSSTTSSTTASSVQLPSLRESVLPGAPLLATPPTHPTGTAQGLMPEYRAGTPVDVPPGYVLFQGDMLLPQQFAAPDAVWGGQVWVTYWPDGRIPYDFDNNSNPTDYMRDQARLAMQIWEAEVPELDFVECANNNCQAAGESNYVTYVNSSFNRSYVGMIGGQQEIEIYNWSYEYIIAHEIMHALGFWHEQSSPIRDTYVQINWANVDPNYTDNFDIQTNAEHTDYDFDSVMHYPDDAFSINGQPTITVLPPYQAWQSLIGQRSHLSAKDVEAVEQVYGDPPVAEMTYDIEVQTDCTGDWEAWQTDVTTTIATYTGDYATTYCFRSRAEDPVGNVESWPAAEDTRTTVVPRAPLSLTASADNFGEVLLEWEHSPDDARISGYKLYRDGSEVTTVAATETTFVDTTVTCETTYDYEITAIYDGVESDPTAAAPVTTRLCPPPAPTNLTAAENGDDIDLNWMFAPGNAQLFFIETSDNGTDWSTLTTVGGQTLSYTVQDVPCGTTSHYRVRAFTESARPKSDPSNEEAVTMSACPTFNAPQNLTGSTTREVVDLTWDDGSPGETDRFEVDQSPTGSGDWQRIATVQVADGTSYTVTGLHCATDYYYRVRGYRAEDDLYSAYSTVYNATTAGCPAASPHMIGLYNNGLWWVRRTLDGGGPDHSFSFGPREPGWVPLTGDWNGNGDEGIGVYKDGVFMLKSDAGEGDADLVFPFGNREPGWQPVVGDWDGDGTDTIGVYKDGLFMLSNNPTAGTTDYVFTLATGAQWVAIAGDWDGNGVDSVGVYANGMFIMQQHVHSSATTQFTFGPAQPGWLPVVGDWNVDGVDSIGLYQNQIWRLSDTNATVDYGFGFGLAQSGWRPFSLSTSVSLPTYIPPEPTDVPTATPTQEPTEEATEAATQAPTAEVTAEATAEATEEATDAATEEPTAAPTEAATQVPSATATEAPTEQPTQQPSATPVPESTEPAPESTEDAG